MSGFALFLLPILLLAVLAVLLIGVAAMFKGGEFNKKYGNKLMQLRVGLQFVAVILLLLFAFTSGD